MIRLPTSITRYQGEVPSIDPDKIAAIVLDGNPFDEDLKKIPEINVLKTMMNGKFTYEAGPEGAGQEEKKGLTRVMLSACQRHTNGHGLRN